MARQSTTSVPIANDIIENFQSFSSSGDLFKFAISDRFKSIFENLSAGDQQAVREAYAIRREEVQNRKKLDEIDGHVVTITKVRTGYSEKFGNDFVVLEGDLEGEIFETISSAVVVVRHFNNPANIKRLPSKYLFAKEDRPNGHSMWTVSALNSQANNNSLPW